MGGLVLAVIVDNGQRDVAAHDDELLVLAFDDIAVADDDLAFGAGFEERAVDHLRRTTDVERTHGELGARFTNRLGGNDAHGFADVDRGAACEVTTVAGCAHTLAGFARQGRADADGLNVLAASMTSTWLSSSNVPLGMRTLARFRIEDVVGGGASEDTLTERCHDLTGIDDGFHRQALLGAAIDLGDDRVLGDVDQTTRQVARVRRLQARYRPDPCGRRGWS